MPSKPSRTSKPSSASPSADELAVSYAGAVLRRLRSILPVAVLAVGWLPASGCSCPDLECNAASVAVDLGGTAGAEICVNGQCGPAQDPISYPVGWVERFFEDVPPPGVSEGEDFELRITVLDADGAALASTTETRTYKADRCRCLFFAYRWTGQEFERTE